MKNADWREELSEVSIALRMPGSPVLTTVKDRAAEVMRELDRAYERIAKTEGSKELSEEIERLGKLLVSEIERRHEQTKAQEQEIKELKERCVGLSIIQSIQDRLSTQEDKIKALEGANGRRVRELNNQDKVLCETQERIEKLDKDQADLQSWAGGLIEGITERTNWLEKTWRGFEDKVASWWRVECLPRIHALEQQTKPKENNLEVIERAIEIMTDFYESSKVPYPSERETILKALTLAEQSLKGDE
jgi:hypothetical protein